MNFFLVTGGAGFIGANFVHYWLNNYPEHKVIVLDALTYAGNLANLDLVKDHPQLKFVHGDILHTDLVVELMKHHTVDTIVHFAAESHVDRSITGPDVFLETNILEDKPLPIYGDGKQVRDWLFVEDHARGIELVLNKGKVGENYNIGGHNEWHNIAIVKLVCQLMDEAFAGDKTLSERFPNATKAAVGASAELITFVKDRPGHDRRYAIGARKSRQELGYMPQESFETGIRKTLQWYLGNENWWRGVMDGSYQDWVTQQYR